MLDMSRFPYSKKKLRESLRDWTPKTLGYEEGKPNVGYWNDEEVIESENLQAIRILVIGNTGVGKSTLINRVFGVPMVSENQVVIVYFSH